MALLPLRARAFAPAGALMRSAALLSLSAAAACGGGGGGSGAAPPLAPSAAPSASPGAPAYRGRAIDVDGGGGPLAGATVSGGTGFTYAPGAGYVVGGVIASTVTAADGTFTLPAAGAASFVQVSAPGLVTLHRPLPAVPAALGDLALPRATAEDLAGLAALNASRSTQGRGAGALSLTLDADLELLARFRVADEASRGYFAHVPPGGTVAGSTQYLCAVAVGAFCGAPVFVQENLALDAASQALAQQSYVSGDPADVHRLNVLSTTDLWVGFGEVLGGKTPPGATGSSADYFATEFFSLTPNPQP